MDWTFDNFPAEMAALDPQVREKAIEILNNPKEQFENVDGSELTKLAIKEAQEWFLNMEG
ncbi:uncharacterized protein YdaT [Pedobacter sp. UYP30]|uniref:hypothetical protein n=1 Tax=Pedobacter sp. UYP30 TaxID=1756400 RepID=UPI00339A6F81